MNLKIQRIALRIIVKREVALATSLSVLFFLLSFSLSCNKCKGFRINHIDSLRVINLLKDSPGAMDVECNMIGFKTFKSNNNYFSDTTLLDSSMLKFLKESFCLPLDNVIKAEQPIGIKTKARIYSGRLSYDICIDGFGRSSINGKPVMLDDSVIKTLNFYLITFRSDRF